MTPRRVSPDILRIDPAGETERIVAGIRNVVRRLHRQQRRGLSVRACHGERERPRPFDAGNGIVPG
jgi:hypothetical protein